MRRGHLRRLLSSPPGSNGAGEPLHPPVCTMQATCWEPVWQIPVCALQICFQVIGALFSNVRHQSIPPELVTNTRNISSSTLPRFLHLPLSVFKPVQRPASPSPHCQPTASASLKGHHNMISFLPSPRYRLRIFLNLFLETKQARQENTDEETWIWLTQTKIMS